MCTQCKTGFKLRTLNASYIDCVPNEIFGCSIANCDSCLSYQSCGQCQVGYEIFPINFGGYVRNWCQKIICPYYIKNCLTCQKNLDSFYKLKKITCTANGCDQGYMNVNGYCISALTTFATTCNVTYCQRCAFTNYCLQCNNGYSLTETGRCQSIRCLVSGCSYCSSPNVCASCYYSFKLMNGNISLADHRDSEASFNSLIATQCYYNRNESKCLIANCKLCLTNSVCATCMKGYNLSAPNVCL